MPLPNTLSFSPFAILTAEELNDMVENDDALQDGSAFDSNSIDGDFLLDGSVEPIKIAGFGWELLGSTTLGSTGTSISVTGLTVKKHLMVLADVRPTGGTLNVGFRFNNDSGSNYAERGSYNGAADGSGGSAAQIPLKGAVDANPQLVTAEIENIAAVEKLVVYHSSDRGTAGAANVPNRKEGTGKWANTTDAITRIDIVDTGGTGDIATGSSIIVLGRS